jgi:hypothetical protein
MKKDYVRWHLFMFKQREKIHENYDQGLESYLSMNNTKRLVLAPLPGVIVHYLINHLPQNPQTPMVPDAEYYP